VVGIRDRITVPNLPAAGLQVYAAFILEVENGDLGKTLTLDTQLIDPSGNEVEGPQALQTEVPIPNEAPEPLRLNQFVGLIPFEFKQEGVHRMETRSNGEVCASLEFLVKVRAH
jgi:hypothetical protein